jgi:hypothetical protein
MKQDTLVLELPCTTAPGLEIPPLEVAHTVCTVSIWLVVHMKCQPLALGE